MAYKVRYTKRFCLCFLCSKFCSGIFPADFTNRFCSTGGYNIFEHCKETSIAFKGVDFQYPSRPDAKILKDFELLVNAGDVCAIVGR